MKINILEKEGTQIAEVIADDIIMSTAEEGLQIVVDVYYQDCDKVILHEKNISPGFFDLKTGLAGEILQKYSNYKMRLAIVGDFEKYSGGSLRDFIRESNRGQRINFLSDVSLAIDKLSED